MLGSPEEFVRFVLDVSFSELRDVMLSLIFIVFLFWQKRKQTHLDNGFFETYLLCAMLT